MSKKYYYSQKLRSTIPRRNHFSPKFSFGFSRYIKLIISIIIIFFVLYILRFIVITIRNRNHGTSISTNINLTLPELSTTLPIKPPSKINTSKPYIPAKSILLLDSTTKKVLFKKNERRRVAIASTTKIMTSIITLEEFSLDDVAIVPKNIYTVPGSKMGLYPNEKISIRNLLYGMLLNSGNDAAYTLASYRSPKTGNIRYFVDKMNQKAKNIGLLDTKYRDPAGLDDSGYSTAYDLAILSNYALNNPTFAKIITTDHAVVRSIDKKYIHTLKNSNRLVDKDQPLYFPYAIGIKTGNTDKAGHCLVSAARKNGHTLISVVLNTYSNDASESARLNRILLSWGYSSFDFHNSP